MDSKTGLETKVADLNFAGGIKYFHSRLHPRSGSSNDFRLAVAIEISRGHTDAVLERRVIGIKLNCRLALNIKNLYLRSATGTSDSNNFINAVTIYVTGGDVNAAVKFFGVGKKIRDYLIILSEYSNLRSAARPGTSDQFLLGGR